MYLLFRDSDYWDLPFVWFIYSSVITSILCLSLQRVRRYARGLAKEDSLESRGLLYVHQSFFMIATLIMLSAFILGIFNTDELLESEPLKNLKILKAGTYLALCGYITWFVVHVLMLRIFYKYGKPLEDDEKTLIENKLVEMLKETQDE